MYWVFALRGTILNILITAFIVIISQSWIKTLIFFIVFEIYLLILYMIRLGSMAEKVHNARLQRGEIEASSEIEFYEDYFIRKGNFEIILAQFWAAASVKITAIFVITGLFIILTPHLYYTNFCKICIYY